MISLICMHVDYYISTVDGCHIFTATEFQCEEIYSNCSASSCGVTGIKTCNRHCRVFERTERELIRDFDEICDSKLCFTHCPTTPTELPVTVPAGKSCTTVVQTYISDNTQ